MDGGCKWLFNYFQGLRTLVVILESPGSFKITWMPAIRHKSNLRGRQSDWFPPVPRSELQVLHSALVVEGWGGCCIKEDTGNLELAGATWHLRTFELWSLNHDSAKPSSCWRKGWRTSVLPRIGQGLPGIENSCPVLPQLPIYGHDSPELGLNPLLEVKVHLKSSL